MINLNDNNAQETVTSTPKLIVQLGASWCVPCKQLKPKVEKLAEGSADIVFAYVDIEAAQDYSMKSKVMSVPTVIGYRNGIEVDRVVGNSESAVKELVEKVRSNM